MGDAGWETRAIKIPPPAAGAQHLQDPWEQLQVRIGASASRGTWRFWEALGNESQLTRREDVAHKERGHGRAPQRTGDIRPLSGLSIYETGSRNRCHNSSRVPPQA